MLLLRRQHHIPHAGGQGDGAGGGVGLGVAGALRLAVKGHLAHRGLQVQRVGVGFAVHRQADVAHPGVDLAGFGVLQQPQVKIAHGDVGGKAAALHKPAGEVAHRDRGVEVLRLHGAASEIAHRQVKVDAVRRDSLVVVKLHIAHGGVDGETFKMECVGAWHGQNKLRLRLAVQVAVGGHFVADGQRLALGVGDVEPLGVHIFAVQGGAGGAGVDHDGQAAIVNVQHDVLRGEAFETHVRCVGAVVLYSIGVFLGGAAGRGLGGGVGVQGRLDCRNNERLGGVGDGAGAHAEKADQQNADHDQNGGNAQQYAHYRRDVGRAVGRGLGGGGAFPGGPGVGGALPCCGLGGVQSQALALQNFAGSVGGVAQFGGGGVLGIRAGGVEIFLVVVQRVLAFLFGQGGEQLRQFG